MNRRISLRIGISHDALLTALLSAGLIISFIYFYVTPGQAAAGKTKPNAPSNLTVTSTSPTRIDLSWTDNSSDESNFVVYRRMWSRDAWTIISKNIAANATAYTDNTVMVGITYYYRILAHNSAGDSAFSNTDYDSTALVSAAQIPTATTFGMPFGEELKGDLNKLTIDTCPNDYPKLRFNDGHPTNEWYVATAFNKNTWVNSQCVSQGLYAPHHDFHPGEDWNSTQGSGAWPSGDGRAPLYAIGNGIVIFNSGECSSTGADAVNQCNNKSWKGGFGNTLIIAHQTVSSEYVLSFYGHMADPSPLVEGTSVNQGDPIGNIGSTGTGAYHLHFEIRRAGMLVINPRTGRLALVEKPGFWPETYYPEDAPQQEFISTNYYAPSEFLKAHQTTNVVGTNATLDGEPWSGVIDYYIVGPNIELFCPSGCTVPASSVNQAAGEYQFFYKSGGPPNSSAPAITPSDTQTLSAGGNITFTMQFVSATPTPTPTPTPSPSPSPDSCVSPPLGLVGWWAGDGNASDLIGGNAGTLMNGAAFSSGEVGQAFSLNGVNQYVEIPDSPSQNPTQAITVDAWIRLADTPPLGGTDGWDPINKDNPSSGPYALRVMHDGSVSFFIYASIGWQGVNSGSGKVSVGTFSHIAGTYDSTTGAFCVYVNGVATCTQASGALKTTTNTLKIGGDVFNGRFFEGEIDEVEIFSRALSLSEIRSIYNAGNAGKCKPTQMPVATELLPYQSPGYRYQVVNSDATPPVGFEQPGFDDSTWNVGTASFGDGVGFCTLQATDHTLWPISTDLLVRRVISIPPGTTNVNIKVAFDNDIIGIFFNGTKIFGPISSDSCPVLDQTSIAVPSALVQQGSNLVVYHVRDRGFESFFDTRILADVPPLVPTLFFDGTADPRFFNSFFREPVIDSQGRLLIVADTLNISCSFGFCGYRLFSISPNGTLTWQAPTEGFLSSDSFALRTIFISPSDRVYVLDRSSVFAFDSTGSAVPGWPVQLPYEFNPSPQPVVIDPINDVLYTRTGLTVSFSGFPISVVASNPDGTQKWRKDYSDGNAGGNDILVQGPAGNIFTLVGGAGVVNLDRNNGSEICSSNVTTYFGDLVGGGEGVFTSFGSSLTVTNDSCNSQLISVAPGPELFLHRYADSKVYGYNFLPGSFDLNDIRLVGFSKDGAFLWRNPEILPNVLGGNNPIRAIRNGVLYVLGKDLTDGNKPKLFLVSATTGQILNKIDTSAISSQPGVAVAPDGTIYINDPGSAKIYKLSPST